MCIRDRPNPVPSFSEVTLERRIIREEDIKEVYEAFLRVHEKIVNPVRPARLKYGSVYAIPKNSARYYSKYLFELNKGGMPYFSIQNFFKRESLNETLPYISKLFGTGVFSAIGGILCGDLPANHDLGEDEQTGQDENKVLINNMADIASNFGVFFALKDKDEKSEKIYNTIENILSFYKQKKYPKIQHWAPITKYVRSAKDPHEIWNYFRASLEQLQPRKPRSTIYDLRAISGVCFQTETWIFDLFHGPNGRDEVEGIIENIIATLYDRDCLSERNPQDKYNPRKIRDVPVSYTHLDVYKRQDMLRPIQVPPLMLNDVQADKDPDDLAEEHKWLEHIRVQSKKSGIHFNERQLMAYHTSLKIGEWSPLVVLSGVSGTGKSELPKQYAIHGGMQFLSVPVKPDWDSPASLFGYYNSIENKFEATELIRALYQMQRNKKTPWSDSMLMVLLDEMNLAHPEQYFADLLSKFEESRNTDRDPSYCLLYTSRKGKGS